ncbi:MAG: HAD family phosphatase [Bacteroidales bacterium]|nr:HAD family phosphatase [Bacteroidales bacterium]MBQ7772398.1 HAD family phosphatase [Bacteroidales bacterium]MBQ8812561.1 HAD family phosphatase [Bacteroidales bacterium]
MNLTVLFDFDGVIADTETQYTEFWSRKGMEYFGLEDFGHTIKGQTLVQIFDKYFKGMDKEQQEVVPLINELEKNMSYEYIPGVYEFMKELKKAGIRSAIVTSSNMIKMEQAFKAQPELPSLVDVILTSEDFTRSKPDPECFITGMKRLGGRPETTFVFEDSFHGLAAGRASGAHVIGLTTTNPRESIAHLCDKVIDDFTCLTIKDLIDTIS